MIDIKLLKDIVTVSDMLGESDRDFVNTALENRLSLYRDPKTGKIEPKPGEWLSNPLEYFFNPETKSAWKPCFILYNRKMYDRLYTCIIADGSFITAPADSVRSSEK